MTYNEAQFNKAVKIVNELPPTGSIVLSTDQKLVFYKHYKQATEGDNTTARPGFMDFTGKAKWDARETVKGKSKEESWTSYVAEFISVVKDSGDPDAKKWIDEIVQLG